MEKVELELKLGMELPQIDFDVLELHDGIIDVFTIEVLKQKIVGTSCGNEIGSEKVLSHPAIINFLQKHSNGKFIFAVEDPNEVPYPNGTDLLVSSMIVWLNTDPNTFMTLIEQHGGSLYYSGEDGLSNKIFTFDSE